jgi:hypothetical protein
MLLDSKIPEGPLAEKWTKHKFNLKLVNPANKRKYDIIVVGTGLAGSSAAASVPEEPTLLLHKVASMLPKTILMIMIAYSGCFMTP